MNTAFDRTAGRIQYVYVIPDVVVTVITLGLMPDGGATTIDVIYERTALMRAANATVKEMALRDRLAGEEWSQQINQHLGQ